MRSNYSHAYDFAFEVVSQRQDAADVTAKMLVAGLKRRIKSLDTAEFLEACGKFDTMEVE